MTDTIQMLKKAYKNKGLVLVLGAGVSYKSGFPNWKTLLERLEQGCMGASGHGMANRLF